MAASSTAPKSTSGITKNLTIDDFDSFLSFSDESQWDTPDPSKGISPVNVQWYEGTYHKSSTVGTTLSFNFEGSAVWLYGASGPSYGSYQITVDGVSTNHSAYAASNASTPYLLFSKTDLAIAQHAVELKVLGPQSGDAGAGEVLFDYAQATFQVAPSGATLKNITYQESDPALRYTGNWTKNVYAPDFSGGYSMYTQAENASVSLAFNGTAIYVFGDVVNDHGLFTVSLDSESQQFDGFAGCRGVGRCEKHGTLAYFASGLGEGQHTLQIVNNADGRAGAPFFDLDVIYVTVPSAYIEANTSSTSPNTTSLTSSKTTSPTSTPTGSANSLEPNWMLLLLFFGLSLYRIRRM